MAKSLIENADGMDRERSGFSANRQESMQDSSGLNLLALSPDSIKCPINKREPNENGIESKGAEKSTRKTKTICIEEEFPIMPQMDGKCVTHVLSPNISLEVTKDRQVLNYGDNQKLIIGTKTQWWTLSSGNRQVEETGRSTISENGRDMPVRLFDNGTFIVLNPDGTKTLRYQNSQSATGLPKYHFSRQEGMLGIELPGIIVEHGHKKPAELSIIFRPDIVNEKK